MSILSTIISPVKGYLLAGAAVVLLSAFGWYTYHERHVEHVKDVAAATKEVAKVTKADVVIKGTADTTVAAQETKHEKDATAPSEPNLGIVCHDSSPNPVPGTAASNGPGNHAADSGASDLFDPSGSLLAVGRNYDAWVRELQADNAALRKELAQAHAVHP
jgi:hypothetical protein